MAYKKIMLKNGDACPQFEANAGEAGILPGHFLMYNSSLNFLKQNESGVAGMMMIAVTDRLQGKKISEAYTSGAPVLARMCQPGTEVYALLAKGHSVTQGDELEFAGFEETGCLGKAEFHSASKGVGVKAVALETVNNSAGSAAVRIRVLVI